MTLEQIKEAPKGTHFTIIVYFDHNHYSVHIVRKIDFIEGAGKHGYVYVLHYESVRVFVATDNAAIEHVKHTSTPVTFDSAKKYYSQKSENFTRAKQMILKAPFLPGITSVEFTL